VVSAVEAICDERFQANAFNFNNLRPSSEDGLDAGLDGMRAVRGWEHMPLPGCRPPPLPVDDEFVVGAAAPALAPQSEVGGVTPQLAPPLYTAVVRSVLLPWGTQAPGETHALRAAAASELRHALGRAG